MERNRYTGPLDQIIPTFVFQGVPLPVIADMPEGGFVQFVTGDNALAQATPGPRLPQGAMVVIILPEIAAQIRPQLKDAENQIARMAGGPGLNALPS